MAPRCVAVIPGKHAAFYRLTPQYLPSKIDGDEQPGTPASVGRRIIVN